MSERRPLAKIVIAGGGSAGWMAAALLSELTKGRLTITLVESDEIGTIGVGEATIPAIKKYNDLLKLDENDFIKKTQGSFKLGIEFVDWLRRGSRYIHGFGVIGQDLGWLRCHQYWLNAQMRGKAAPFSNYSINTAAALAGKFMRPRPDLAESPISHIAYAFHFDATLYARMLRGYAEQRGVIRREGKIVDVALDPENGFIRSLTLEGERTIEGDLFLDCTGFHALLIEKTLKTGYEDWSRYLPCDRAIAMPCERGGPFTPYTRSTAREAGWQWRIPLQHRTGNGYVYSSQFLDAEEAERVLAANLDGAPTASGRHIRFVTGKRRKIWSRNCVAIGLSSGFLEPLESTSLHLIQSGLIRLVKLLPDMGFAQAGVDEFNRQTDFEYERIRDFLILHYKATERDDTPFWRYCRGMEIPETLRRKIDLFSANGRIFREDDELFNEESWIQVFLGQGVVPAFYDPLVGVESEARIDQFLGDIDRVIGRCVAVMPRHEDFVAQTCPAPGL